MGAYYEYQISYNPVPWKGRTICLPTLGGMKFLETFYARTGNTLFLLDLLQEYGEAVVNTVCDYDKKGIFVYGVPYATHDTLNKVERAMADSIKEMDETDWRDKCSSFKGFVVLCDEREEYVRLTPFLNASWALSPIALLTRSSKTAQGGGDFDVDELNCEDSEFIPSLAFDPDMIGSWMGCEIRLDDYIPDGYKDITDKVFVEERI